MSNHPDHIVPVRVYILVFLALLVGTGLTVFAATIDLGRFNIVLALFIACIKAALVVLFFMHVYYSSRLTKAIVISGLCTLLILFFFTLTDLLTRGAVQGSTDWVGVPGR
jgi:cytochrome c oxidase subunit IV